MPRRTPDPANVPTPLTKLLLDRMAANEWELRDVTRPPDGTREGAPARSTMSWYLQPGRWLKTLPRPATMEELATAVRVTPETIEEAAFRSLTRNAGKKDVTEQNPRPQGEIDRRPVGYDLNAEADGLTDEDIEPVLAVVRAIKRAKGL